MKKYIKWLVLFAVVLAAGLVVRHYVASSTSADVGALVSEKVKLTTISTTISATGSLEPVDEVEVGT